MSKKNGRLAEAAWQDRVHQLRFTDAQLVLLREGVENDQRSFHDVIVDLVADNCALKVKGVEYYSSYTVSCTLDKAHPDYPGHTFWFYDTDLGRGVRVMSLFVSQFLEQAENVIGENNPYSLW